MKTKIFILMSALIIVFSFGSQMALAQEGVPIDKSLYPKGAPSTLRETPGQEFSNPEATRMVITNRIVNVLFSLAGIVAIFFIVQNGFWLTMSAGGEEKVTQAKKGIMWAIIGLILVILSYSIVRFVISIPWSADSTVNPEEAAAQTKSILYANRS